MLSPSQRLSIPVRLQDKLKRLLSFQRTPRSQYETYPAKWWQEVGHVWNDMPHVPTMLTGEELQLLYWLGSKGYTGSGSIVELGSFLGGSTKCLTSGLLKQPESQRTRKVHVYDLFKYDPYYEHWFKPFGWSFKEGDSFLPAFNKFNAELTDVIDVHAGDILTAKYDAGPIEILFVDICKTWDINTRVVDLFFRHLIPGKSFVVQQDYLHFYSYWLILTMDYYKKYFERISQVDHGSTVLYHYTRKIPSRYLKFDASSMTLKQKRAAFDRELERNTGSQRSQIQVSYYRMLHEAGDREGARAIVRDIDHTDELLIASSALTFIEPEHRTW